MFQHKPFLRPRVLERVERDRQVDDSGRTERENGIERSGTDGSPRRPTAALDLHEPPDDVIPGPAQAELPCGVADCAPGLSDGRIVAVEADDERVNPRVVRRQREAHLQSVPAAPWPFVTIR